MRAGSVYVVTNKINGHQYVGLTTKTVAHRWSEHKTSAVIGKKTYLYSALRKYGPEHFTVAEYLVAFDAAELSALEREIIQDLRPVYNQTNGGEHTRGRKHTPEVIERIRASNTGKIRTLEQIARFKEIIAQNTAHQMRLRSPENLAVLAAARAKTDPKKRIAAAKAANTGRKMSAEARAKLSASCVGRRYGSEIIAKMAATKRKPVKCNETGVVYSCREEAVEKTGVSSRTIVRDLKGEKRSPKNNRPTFSYI